MHGRTSMTKGDTCMQLKVEVLVGEDRSTILVVRQKRKHGHLGDNGVGAEFISYTARDHISSHQLQIAC